MLEAPPKVMVPDRTISNDIVQLHQLSHKKVHNHPVDVNTLLLKKLHNQSRRKRKKRKRKEGNEIINNLYYFKNHSYNHITTDNNNGDHIIKSNSNEERRRRKVKSIELVDSNKRNHSRSMRRDDSHEKNLTLWIFRIKKQIDSINGKFNIDDDVRRCFNINFHKINKKKTEIFLFFFVFRSLTG